MKPSKVYREYAGPDGEPLRARVMPPDASIEDLEAAVIEDVAVAMSDRQQALLDKHFSEGVTHDGRAR